MALLVIVYMIIVRTLGANGEMALANVTRFSSGDLYTLAGTDCGLTRCMEESHGTALASLGSSGCVCQCSREYPAFREDQKVCVNHIEECPMATFGRGATEPQIPFVFLPLKGQIIYPAKEIIFTDVQDAICAVTSAQYLTPAGWVTLRDVVDNDVPFGLYRDEGSTFLQWRGSSTLHARLEGRLIAVHVLCSSPKPGQLATSCAAFRVAGYTRNTILDVRSIPFQAGETVTTEPTSQSRGLSVLESLAIGVCVLMLVFVYAAGIIFYIHYKQKQKRAMKDPEMSLSRTLSTDNGSTMDSRIGMDSMRMKSNPLLNLDIMRSDYSTDAGLSDVSEHTEDTFDSSPTDTQKFQDRSPKVVSAVVHSRKKPSRPRIRASTPERINERIQRRSSSPELEKAPHSDLSILHCVDNESVQLEGEPVIRRKLYFNPVFFEIDLLKNPPPAAIEFLMKLREVMSLAKEKMTSKRFVPVLSDILEEESYHTIDLGWEIPCLQHGRRFSAISLKRENSRRSIQCGGCPGCDSSKAQNNTNLLRSNSCKTCVSDDFKQKIVQRWLDEVPTHVTVNRPVKSVAKVSGTPRVTEPKEKEVRLNPVEPVANIELETIKINESIVKEELNNQNIIDVNNKVSKHFKTDFLITKTNVIATSETKNPLNHATRRVRKQLPPPPPPPTDNEVVSFEELEPISPEVKRKMRAVIQELNKCQRIEQEISLIPPKIIIPVVAEDSKNLRDTYILTEDTTALENESSTDLDSLEHKASKKRRFSLDYGPELSQKNILIQNNQMSRDRLTRSWRDLKNTPGISSQAFLSQSQVSLNCNSKIITNNNIFIKSVEPIYNNVDTPGPLTIEVRGSPIVRRRKEKDDFDPDTLDRKPKRQHTDTTEQKKSVDKILLKSGGSFKHKLTVPETEQKKSPPESTFTRNIGSLRQIYEANKSKELYDRPFYARRGSIPFVAQEEGDMQSETNPPLLKKKGPNSKSNTPRNSPSSERYRSSEERDRFPPYSHSENIISRRSGRRSASTRSRRVDLKKLSRTEDSGYLSTDSNESKQKTRYLLQMKPKIMQLESIHKTIQPNSLHIDTDTDDLESLCDGRSESGGESIETDSVFFGSFDDSKQIFEEFGLDLESKPNQSQIDSGFVGETNIILSGDSDSEHKSVISIVTGRDGRASATSLSNLDDSPYVQSVECN